MPINIENFVAVLEKETAEYKTPIVDLIAVQTNDPYKVLVATILSARTRDETTSRAAARLFKKAPDLESLAGLDKDTIEKLIYPVGFSPTKAGYLAKLPEALNREFNGRIPDNVNSLTKLPGVGRKTANLVVSVAFDRPAICVDTHVHRIMNIWGYVRTKTPLATEKALRKKLPQKHWKRINSLLVAFGQGMCRPVGPLCDRCVLEKECPKNGVTPRRLPKKKKDTDVNGMKKFISWNVNGIRAVEKKGFLETVVALDADILAIQEIRAHPEQIPDSIRNISGYTSFWYPAQKKGYAGVGFYTRQEPLQVIYGMKKDVHDQEGRVMTLEYEDYFIINAYFPNAQHGLTRLDYKLEFNQDLLAFANLLATKKTVVICGDFNVAHKEIDLKNPKENEKNPGFSPDERAWMDTFISSGYIDTFRKFTQDPGHYTWWSYRFNARARNIGWRIDYFCVDKKSESRVKGASILKDIMGSDHCPVDLDFA